MTRAEAQISLAKLKQYMSGGGVVDRKANEALDMAIEALRQPERKTGRWAEIHGNKNMRICQSCGFMVNKSLLYDYTEKDPLVFKYCPNCGADMRGVILNDIS